MTTAAGPITDTKEFPFLDPLELASIKVGSMTFQSVESLFLASSFEDPEIRQKFTELNGHDARVLYTQLKSINAKQRPDWLDNTKDVGGGSVPGYMELLRRSWYLRFVQDPDSLDAFVDTGYRPLRIELKYGSGSSSNWLGDIYLNDVLTMVRAQLRELTPEMLGQLHGVGGPGAAEVAEPEVPGLVH